MRKIRFAEKQIIGMAREAEVGSEALVICRREVVEKVQAA